LTYSAVFAYNRNSIPSTYTTFFDGKTNDVVAVLLALYPVFTLTTNFPLICITLRNNLVRFVPEREDGAWLWVKRFKRPISTLVALVPSIAIAFATCDVSLLVSITGSFPGLGIMFFMPLALVFFARRRMNHMFKDNPVCNKHRSPFHHWLWLVVVSIISCGFLVLTIYNIIDEAIKGKPLSGGTCFWVSNGVNNITTSFR